MDNLWEIAKQRGRKKSGRKIARIHGGCWTSSQQTDGSDGENSEGPAIKDEEWSSPKKDQFISFSSGGHGECSSIVTEDVPLRAVLPS